jgi:hypothetical protein
MLEKLSAAQLVKVFNAVTDREKPVKKFESHARALALTTAELDRMGVAAPVALARAGLPVPADTDAAAYDLAQAESTHAWPEQDDAAEPVAEAPKLLTYAPAPVCANCEAPLTAENMQAGSSLCHACAGRNISASVEKPGLRSAGRSPRLGPKPGRETLKKSQAHVPTAINAINGETVELRSLHGPVRTVEGDPEKAARKVASAAVAELRKARKAKAAEPAEKVLVRTETWPYAKAVTVPAVEPAPAAEPVSKAAAPRKAPTPATGALSPDHILFLKALRDAKVFAGKPVEARVGQWVKYGAVHDSDSPHNLPKGRMPGLTRVVRHRGLIDIRVEGRTLETCLTAAGLEAIIGS